MEKCMLAQKYTLDTVQYYSVRLFLCNGSFGHCPHSSLIGSLLYMCVFPLNSLNEIYSWEYSGRVRGKKEMGKGEFSEIEC